MRKILTTILLATAAIAQAQTSKLFIDNSLGCIITNRHAWLPLTLNDAPGYFDLKGPGVKTLKVTCAQNSNIAPNNLTSKIDETYNFASDGRLLSADFLQENGVVRQTDTYYYLEDGRLDGVVEHSVSNLHADHKNHTRNDTTAIFYNEDKTLKAGVNVPNHDGERFCVNNWVYHLDNNKQISQIEETDGTRSKWYFGDGKPLSELFESNEELSFYYDNKGRLTLLSKAEKDEDIDSEDGSPSLTEISISYNEKGLPSRIGCKSTDYDPESKVKLAHVNYSYYFTYTYTFDARGNWTVCTVYASADKKKYTIRRTITYY